MKKKTLIKKKTQLEKKMNSLMNEIIIGSLYQTEVNCGIKTCKKCKDKIKGHIANHLGYQTSDGKHKTTYISKKISTKIKKGNQFYKNAKKLLMDIGEINLLILKAVD